MTDAYVPTEAGITLAELLDLDEVAGELVASLRRSAADDDWGDVADRPSPEKLARIADFIEGALPLTCEVDARRLRARLRIVGLM